MLVHHRFFGSGNDGSLLGTGATPTATPPATAATAAPGIGIRAPAHGIDRATARTLSTCRNGRRTLLGARCINRLRATFRTRTTFPTTLATSFTARLAPATTTTTIRTLSAFRAFTTFRTLGALRTLTPFRTFRARRIIAACPRFTGRTRLASALTLTRGLPITGWTPTATLAATATIAITATTAAALLAVATAATGALGRAIFRVTNRAARTGDDADAERARTEAQETA